MSEGTSEVMSFFTEDEGEATPETQVREVAEDAADAAAIRESEGDESVLFTDEVVEEAAGEPDLATDLGFTEEPTALKDRIKTISAQRREARTEAREAKEALEVAKSARTEAEQRLEKLGLLAPLAKSYERFGDKAAEQATRDVTMLEVLEEFSGTDQAVNAVAQRLVAEANRRIGNPTPTPARPTVSDEPVKTVPGTSQPVSGSPAPPKDPRVDAMLAERAEGVIATTLEGVRPLFRATLKDKLLAEIPAEQVTATKVKEFAREYVAENGLTQADVLVDQADPSARKGKTPPTKGTKARGAARGSGKPAAEGEERAKPQTLNELNADRRKRISAMFPGS